jgi:hypothetical protein
MPFEKSSGMGASQLPGPKRRRGPWDAIGTELNGAAVASALLARDTGVQPPPGPLAAHARLTISSGWSVRVGRHDAPRSTWTSGCCAADVCDRGSNRRRSSGTLVRADAVDVQIAGRGHERRLVGQPPSMAPMLPWGATNPGLAFCTPGTSARLTDDGGRAHDGFVADEVPDARVIQRRGRGGAAGPANLLPGDRPARLRDDAKSPEAALHHERAAQRWPTSRRALRAGITGMPPEPNPARARPERRACAARASRRPARRRRDPRVVRPRPDVVAVDGGPRDHVLPQTGANPRDVVRLRPVCVSIGA